MKKIIEKIWYNNLIGALLGCAISVVLLYCVMNAIRAIALAL